MSQDLQTRTPPIPPQLHEPPTPKFDLSVTKILGGALAAMTAAALGSRLSVAGTVVGAAVASIVAAVASALYTASLKHTQDKVRTVFTGRVVDESRPGSEVPTTVETRSSPDDPTSDRAPAQPSAPEARISAPATRPGRGAARLSWKGILVGAVAAFAIAAGTLTGFELLSGQALSGGDGTTVSQVGSGAAPAKSPSPAADPQGTATADPSPDPSSTPGPADETPASPGATSEPSASSSPSTPAPSATTDPSESSGAQTPAPEAGGSEVNGTDQGQGGA